MKQDILEQLVEDWLQAQGYFTRTNFPFKPGKSHLDYDSKKDSVASDIDVIGFHPAKSGPDRVKVVGCKAWQDGFEIEKMRQALVSNQNQIFGNKEAWKHFRELVNPKWTEAFLQAIKGATGSDDFTYVTAVTVSYDLSNKDRWENETTFKSAMRNNPVKIVTLQEMLGEVFQKLGTSVESSQFSRTLQLIKAAGLTLTLHADKPKRPLD
jgi:hypothetical protein